MQNMIWQKYQDYKNKTNKNPFLMVITNLKKSMSLYWNGSNKQIPAWK